MECLYEIVLHGDNTLYCGLSSTKGMIGSLLKAQDSCIEGGGLLTLKTRLGASKTPTMDKEEEWKNKMAELNAYLN